MKGKRIVLPEDVAYIIRTLEEAGFEAYAVGGCVRDTLLGRKPQDWDITTSARPQETKSLFRKTIDTGIQHGTVTVMLHHVGYEVTTYRIDGEYEDNRHPKSVEFTDNLKLDLERRDFTINAMAYNGTRGLVDEFCGMEDMEKQIIRCVGDAGARFDEDALRILRAVRFAGQLGFAIEEETRQAAVLRAVHLKNISAERIRVELSKLLVAKDAGRLRDAFSMGMTKVFLPEFDEMMVWEQKNPHHSYTVGEHSLRSVEILNTFYGKYSGTWDSSIIPEEVSKHVSKMVSVLDEKTHMILALTLLLHDLGKIHTMTIDNKGIGHFYGHQEESARLVPGILRRLTFDNYTIDTVKRLVLFHDYKFGEKEKSMRRAMAKIGADLMTLLFVVQYCDVLAQNPQTISDKIRVIRQAEQLWQRVVDSGAALTLKELEITGKDIMELGVSPGPAVGKMLKQALEVVLEEPEKNDREVLLGFLRKSLVSGGEIG